MLVDPQNEFVVTQDAMLRNVQGDFNAPTTGGPDVDDCITILAVYKTMCGNSSKNCSKCYRGTTAQCDLHDQKMSRASRRLEATLSRRCGR